MRAGVFLYNLRSLGEFVILAKTPNPRVWISKGTLSRMKLSEKGAGIVLGGKIRC